MIPKILHYVWVGGPLPPTYSGYIDTWRQTNPDFKIICWNEQNIDFSIPLVAEMYNKKHYNKVSDLVRHKAVLEMGGIYLDTDIQVFRHLGGLLDYHCFYGFQHEQHPTDWIAPALFGAEPKHWFIQKVWDRMLVARNSIAGLDIPTAIGPKLLTTLMIEEGLKGYSPAGVMVKDIFLAPTHWFYPFGQNEEFTPEQILPDTLAAHFWEKSWEANVTFTGKMARFVNKSIRQLRTR